MPGQSARWLAADAKEYAATLPTTATIAKASSNTLFLMGEPSNETRFPAKAFGDNPRTGSLGLMTLVYGLDLTPESRGNSRLFCRTGASAWGRFFLWIVGAGRTSLHLRPSVPQRGRHQKARAAVQHALRT